MTFTIIERDEVGYKHGSGWGERPTAFEVFIHYPGAKPPPGPYATLEEDLAYARYLDEVGYSRFRDADLTAEGIDAWPGDPGAGISYSLLFCQSGRIIRGHDPTRQSSHTKGHNYTGMGYCILVAEGEEPQRVQLDAVVWAAHEQARRGELAYPTITGGHRDVYPTICPTDAVYDHIPELRARVTEGATMARRRPTRADMNALVANQRARGFEHYCTPYSHDRGICPSHGGTDPHSWDSRHRRALAVDFGWPGAPISDEERIHVLLEMKRLANDPHINWRRLFNISATNHPDHGHVDDMGGIWANDVRDRTNVMAKDGISVFVSPKAFPDHIPPTNRDGSFRLVDGVAAQRAMARLVNPATGKAFYTGAIDGYLGAKSRAAARAVQEYLDIQVDGRPGRGTLAAIEEALRTPSGPELFGFTVERWRRVQLILSTLINPATERPYLVDPDGQPVDGDPGDRTLKALRAFQKHHGLEVDGLPGDGETMPTLEDAYEAFSRPKAPAPKPTPEPTPEPTPPPRPTLAQRVAPYRISGSDAPRTAVAAATAKLPAGKGLLLYRRNTPDEGAALQASWRAADPNTIALPINADGTLPSSIRDYASSADLAWIRAIGGPVSVTDRALSTALTAAGIKH